MRHMDEGLLQAWLDGPRAGLTEEERAAVEAHVATCPECADRLADLRASDDRVAELLAPARVSDEEIPAFAEVEARAREFASDRASPSLPRSPWRGAAWAASIAVALGAGWLANERSGPADEPLLAPIRVTEGPQAAGESEPDAEGAGVPGAPTTTIAEAVPDSAPPGVAEEEPTMLAEAAPATVPAAGRPSIQGRVVDEVTGRPLVAAQVSLPGSEVGALTNAEGRFRLLLAPGVDSAEVAVRVDLLGYRSEERVLTVTDEEVVMDDLGMAQTAIQLDQLVVTGVEEPEADAKEPGAGEGATSGPVAVPDLDDVAWVDVPLDDLPQRVDFPVATVPGLEIVAVRLGTFDDVAVLGVEQALADGATLTLIQAARPIAFTGGGPGSTANRVRDDGVVVMGRAELPADSVAALLRRVR